MHAKPVYKALASLMEARRNCIASNNIEWRDKHEENALALVDEMMPSGSGIDHGTELDVDASTGEKLVFHIGFHHMNENGYYDGWTTHAVTVRASLTSDFDLSISGRNRNDIKDYLHETFDCALRANVVFADGKWTEQRETASA